MDLSPLGSVIFSCAMLALAAAAIIGALGLNRYSEENDAEENRKKTESRG